MSEAKRILSDEEWDRFLNLGEEDRPEQEPWPTQDELDRDEEYEH